MASVSAFPKPGVDGGNGYNYFKYINMPAPYNANGEGGYRPDNPYPYNSEQYLSQKGDTLKAKLKWHDGYEGHGENYFDYNHVGPKEPVHGVPALIN